jgi:hypothetical protein
MFRSIASGWLSKLAHRQARHSGDIVVLASCVNDFSVKLNIGANR